VFLLSREVRWLIQVKLFLDQTGIPYDPEMPFPAFRSGVLPAFAEWVGARGIPPRETFVHQKPYAAYHRFKESAGFDLPGLVVLLERLLKTNTRLVSTSVAPEIALERLLAGLGEI
jgi:hypothetical protein